MQAAASIRPIRCSRAVVLALALCLAACVQRAPETPAQTAQGIPPAPVVTATAQHRLIFVNPRTGQISPYSQVGFQSFLAAVSPGNPEAIHLRLTGPVSQKVLMQVRDSVVADGVPRPKISLVSTGSARKKSRADVAIQVDAVVYKIVPPSCPRPSHTTIGDYENTPSSDYGCAFVSNMDAMIADPRDLVRGEKLGEMDSTVTSGAIDRLHQDKVKDFLKDNSFTAGGS